MSCFRGGVDDGSAGCQTSVRQRQPSPRATRLWVLGLHSSRTSRAGREPQPQPRAATPHKDGATVAWCWQGCAGSFPSHERAAMWKEGHRSPGCAGKKLGTSYLCESPYFQSILSHTVSPRLTPACDRN